MLKKILCQILLVSVFLYLASGYWFLVASFAQTSEEITITTYYPSPYGVYNEMAITSRQAIGDVNGDSVYTNADMAVDQFGVPIPGSLTVAGSVGIGTTVPDRKLHVDSTLAPDIARFSGPDGGLLDITNVAGGGMRISTDATGDLGFRTAGITGTEQMYINTDGNVGIGTTTPTAKLDVNGNMRFNGQKVCDPVDSPNFNSPMLVPSSWTGGTCNNFRGSIGAADYQLGCIFENSFSWGGLGGGIPSPNCGW